MILDKIAGKLLAWSEDSGIRFVISKPGEKRLVRGTPFGEGFDVWRLGTTPPGLCLVSSLIIFIVNCPRLATMDSSISPRIIVFVQHCDVRVDGCVNLVLRGILVLDRLRESSQN